MKFSCFKSFAGDSGKVNFEAVFITAKHLTQNYRL